MRSVIVVFLALLSVSATIASKPSGDQEPTVLVQWLLNTGKASVIRARVAAAMGLDNEDIPVIERGFRKIGDEITHVMTAKVGVGDLSENFLCFARINEADGSGTIWKTSLSGALQVTALVDPDGGVRILPNGGQQTTLAEERAYFLSKMRERNGKGGP